MAEPILIVGAGIAGLATALALQRRGIDCVVAEAAREIVPLGVGINLLPHGVRVLAGLDLLPALAEVSVELRALEFRTAAGRRIHRDPRGRHAGLPWPQLSIHRGNLQEVLYRSVRQRHGEAVVRCGLRLQTFESSTQGVTAVFEDRRQGGTLRLHTPLLIGADGVLSRVRSLLRPQEGPPRPSGIMMARGLTWAAPIGDGGTMVIQGTASHKAVLYPIRPPRADGKQLINWVLESAVPFGPQETGGLADWNRPLDPQPVAALFEDLAAEDFDLPALVRVAERCLAYPMVDRDPIPTWVTDRVALMGDAAHPMYPIGANSASQALLDAAALAQAIAALPEDLPGALQAYQEQRLPQANAVVQANRAEGPEALLALAAQRLAQGPVAEGETLLPADTIAQILGDYQRIAGFAPEALGARPDSAAC